MTPEILIKLAIIAFGLYAIMYVVRRAEDIISAAVQIVAAPGFIILRAVVMIATLPAAFSMMTAEKDLASLMGKNADADQVEKIRLKMAGSVKTAWFNAQTDNSGTRDAFRLARAFA